MVVCFSTRVTRSNPIYNSLLFVLIGDAQELKTTRREVSKSLRYVASYSDSSFSSVRGHEGASEEGLLFVLS